MGFSFDISVPVLTVFLQGLVSFSHPACFRFCPCTSDICQEGPENAGRMAASTMSGKRS